LSFSFLDFLSYLPFNILVWILCKCLFKFSRQNDTQSSLPDFTNRNYKLYKIGKVWTRQKEKWRRWLKFEKTLAYLKFPWKILVY